MTTFWVWHRVFLQTCTTGEALVYVGWRPVSPLIMWVWWRRHPWAAPIEFASEARSWWFRWNLFLHTNAGI